MAAAGSAVGIGNLVGFPVNAAKNGGGAFLFIYLLFVFGVCLPVLLAELTMGKHTRQTPMSAFGQQNGLTWRIAGWLATLTPFMIAVFYSVITVWILGYLHLTAVGNLNQLAKPEFFGQFIQSDSLLMYMLALIALIGLILFGGVQQGIERASRLLMPALFVILIGLCVFVLTLDNATAGLAFYLTPDFSKVNIEVINGALSQASFSLSLGMGILITYGSYLEDESKITSSGYMIAGTDTLVAFVAGLMTLPAIFAIYPETDPATLSGSSVGLVFSFFPKIFMEMVPLIGYTGASIAAFVFFSLTLIAAVTSLVSIFEVPLASLQDHIKITRKSATLITVTLILLGGWVASQSFGRSPWLTEFVSYGGATKSLFDLIVDVFYETILPLNGLLVCLYVSAKWQVLKSHLPDTEFTTRYSQLALRSFIPIILLVVFISTIYSKYFIR